MKTRHTMTDALSMIAHEGARKRIADFCAAYPVVVECSYNCDEDGEPCGGTYTVVRGIADAAVHVADWMNDRDTFEFVAQMDTDELKGWFMECNQDIRKFLTVGEHDRNERDRKARDEAAWLAQLERIVRSERIEASVGSVDWFAALRLACEAASELVSDEQRFERYATSRACGQSSEGYWSDEDGIRDGVATIHDAWAWACENMPLGYARYCEARKR